MILRTVLLPSTTLPKPDQYAIYYMGRGERGSFVQLTPSVPLCEPSTTRPNAAHYRLY
jgi:hypothetical protein